MTANKKTITCIVCPKGCQIEAWEEGFVLSKELGLRISKDDYDKYAARNFVTYC